MTFSSSYFYDTMSVPSSSQPSNPFPPNLNLHDAHLHATLQRIDELANEDMEMRAPLSEGSTFLVLDTNILLHHFDVLTQFVDDIGKLSLPVIVIVPGAVIYELDGQKNRDGLAWFARRASAWLLKNIKEKTHVRGQANEETCKKSGNWKVRVPGEDYGSERLNDSLILDCCLYFRGGRRTFLCSADKNICIESESGGITTISPTRNWSSRDIASVMFEGYEIDLEYFEPYHRSYRDPRSNSIALVPVVDQVDDNSMMVDDDTFMSETLEPSHALDLLHIQIIDHFTRLLVELVGRVGGPEIHNYESSEGVFASRHAPQLQGQRQHYSRWTIAESLEYLNSKKKGSITSPRVEVFLSKPYSYRGARRGQDWSRRDWEVALQGLSRIGDIWEEVSIEESLRVLDRHVVGIFGMKMRPTGI